jgi:hypothetical protein
LLAFPHDDHTGFDQRATHAQSSAARARAVSAATTVKAFELGDPRERGGDDIDRGKLAGADPSRRRSR